MAKNEEKLIKKMNEGLEEVASLKYPEAKVVASLL